MGNSKLKEKVRNDRRQKQIKKNKNTFHKPKADMMYDAFDDLEEEMIGEGVIGNGNKASNKIERISSVAQPKQLDWNTGQSSRIVTKNGRGSGSRHRSSDDDGWF